MLRRLSASAESLQVDHDLPSEDALAVVDRDRLCDGSQLFRGDRRGAMRGSRLPSCFLADALNCVYSFNTDIQSYAELIKLSCQLKSVFAALV